MSDQSRAEGAADARASSGTDGADHPPAAPGAAANGSGGTAPVDPRTSFRVDPARPDAVSVETASAGDRPAPAADRPQPEAPNAAAGDRRSATDPADEERGDRTDDRDADPDDSDNSDAGTDTGTDGGLYDVDAPGPAEGDGTAVALGKRTTPAAPVASSEAKTLAGTEVAPLSPPDTGGSESAAAADPAPAGAEPGTTATTEGEAAAAAEQPAARGWWARRRAAAAAQDE
ncbi:hypothetical protein HCN56_25230, partial [Streptomyces lonarensis]|nr:hypothetical protein [Streptomyces lonarensis]